MSRGLIRVEYVESVRRAEDCEAYIVSRYYATEDNKQQHLKVKAGEVRMAAKHYPGRTPCAVAQIYARDKLEDNERIAGLRS